MGFPGNKQEYNIPCVESSFECVLLKAWLDKSLVIIGKAYIPQGSSCDYFNEFIISRPTSSSLSNFMNNLCIEKLIIIGDLCTRVQTGGSSQ